MPVLLTAVPVASKLPLVQSVNDRCFALSPLVIKVNAGGKLGAPIKDVNIMGNGPKMLSNMVMVANDFEFSQGGAGGCGKGNQTAPCGFGQPTCLVKSLTVGGTRR